MFGWNGPKSGILVLYLEHIKSDRVVGSLDFSKFGAIIMC